MEVQILSRKFIKPSAPTPSHLRNFKISLLDQLAPTVHVNIIFYYPIIGEVDDSMAENLHRRSQLEKSLSETLTVFYPFAGRYIRDDLAVDCNDEGVAYLEAQVNGELARILDGSPEPELLDNFIPCETGELDSTTTQFIAIQANSFRCGGLAVCVQFSHRIADGVTMAAFIDAWATASRAGIREVIRPCFGLPSHIPARSLPAPKHRPSSRENIGKIVTKKLVFDGEAISNLKARAGGQTTRVAAVTAVIWKALICVAQAKHGRLRASLIQHSVSLRGKTIPPMPDNCFGNFYTTIHPQFMGDESKMELHDLVGLIKDATRETIKKPILNSDEFFLMVINSFEEVDEKLINNEVDFHIFTSWCRFPFYEADFGWGKPSWVSSVSWPAEVIILIDTKSGDGIEAWVSLNEQDMLQFQQEQDIKTFSSY